MAKEETNPVLVEYIEISKRQSDRRMGDPLNGGGSIADLIVAMSQVDENYQPCVPFSIRDLHEG